MSYSNTTSCPKCGMSSSNHDMCDSCGALISRIRKRETETNLAQINGTGQWAYQEKSRTSWTKVAMITVAVLVVGIFLLRRSNILTPGGDSPFIHSVFAENWKSEVMEYKQSPVLVDFHATWCGPCKMLAPNLEQLAADNSSRLKVVKVDIDRDPELAQQYGVRSVPTVLLLKNGSEITRTIGALPVAQLKSTFEPHL